MPVDAHLVFGFGSRLEACDMLLFQSSMQESKITDCYYDSKREEYVDTQQDWMLEVLDYGSRRNKLYKARRAIDTGDKSDFMFQLDREMVLAYQYSKTKTDYERHEFLESHPLLLLSDGQTYKGWDELGEMRRVPVYETHAYWMFFVWMPLGLFLIWSKRYLKTNWKVWHVLHIIAGMVTLFVSVW